MALELLQAILVDKINQEGLNERQKNELLNSLSTTPATSSKIEFFKPSTHKIETISLEDLQKISHSRDNWHLLSSEGLEIFVRRDGKAAAIKLDKPTSTDSIALTKNKIEKTLGFDVAEYQVKEFIAKSKAKNQSASKFYDRFMIADILMIRMSKANLF
jgi:hypothetical protein